ncbi:MAG TPA: hypothetical protein VLC09_02595 [Polyangiaceae bacterium]|nr:hypothetical protein [Polyangiaceae bacterium]
MSQRWTRGAVFCRAAVLCGAAVLSLGCGHGGAITIDQAGDDCPTIAPGQTYRGEVTKKVERFGWLEPARMCFHGEKGDRVTFRMTSDPRDDFRRGALVSLRDREGVPDDMVTTDVEVNDTKESSTGSVVLPASGDYELSFFTAAPMDAESQPFQLEFLPIQSRLLEVQEGVVVQGALDEHDGPDQNGKLSDVYMFRAKKDQMHVYRYVVNSTEFEPQLLVRSDRLDVPPQNEFGDPDFRSMENDVVYLEVRAQPDGAQRGKYTIEVTDRMAPKPEAEGLPGGSWRFE